MELGAWSSELGAGSGERGGMFEFLSFEFVLGMLGMLKHSKTQKLKHSPKAAKCGAAGAGSLELHEGRGWGAKVLGVLEKSQLSHGGGEVKWRR